MYIRYIVIHTLQSMLHTRMYTFCLGWNKLKSRDRKLTGRHAPGVLTTWMHHVKHCKVTGIVLQENREAYGNIGPNVPCIWSTRLHTTFSAEEEAIRNLNVTYNRKEMSTTRTLLIYQSIHWTLLHGFTVYSEF